MLLKNVPDRLKTSAICLAAVRAYGGNLAWVPEEMRTPEMCLAAVLASGSNIGFVPNRLKTPEMCLQAVQEYGENLRLIPEALRTREVCGSAVRQNLHALQFVPEMLRAAVAAPEQIRALRRRHRAVSRTETTERKISAPERRQAEGDPATATCRIDRTAYSGLLEKKVLETLKGLLPADVGNAFRRALERALELRFNVRERLKSASVQLKTCSLFDAMLAGNARRSAQKENGRPGMSMDAN